MSFFEFFFRLPLRTMMKMKMFRVFTENNNDDLLFGFIYSFIFTTIKIALDFMVNFRFGFNSPILAKDWDWIAMVLKIDCNDNDNFDMKSWREKRIQSERFAFESATTMNELNDYFERNFPIFFSLQINSRFLMLMMIMMMMISISRWWQITALHFCWKFRGKKKTKKIVHQKKKNLMNRKWWMRITNN